MSIQKGTSRTIPVYRTGFAVGVEKEMKHGRAESLRGIGKLCLTVLGKRSREYANATENYKCGLGRDSLL